MANISNINDFFVVDSAGLKAAVGADLANGNGSPYVGTDFTVVGRDASSPVANLWLSNFTYKSYVLISDNSSNFIIRDSAAGNRLTIDTNGNSTFEGDVNVQNASTRIISLNYEDSVNSIISHSGTNFGLESLNVRGDAIRFYTDYDASSPKGNLTLTLDTSHNATFAGTVETTTLRTDVVNNKANSANIIYRSGTDTLVGGGGLTAKVYIQDSGNVGIGTDLPDTKLDVSGTIKNYATQSASTWLQGNGGGLNYGMDIFLTNDLGSTQGATRFRSAYGGGGTIGTAGYPNFSISRSTTTQAYNSNPDTLTYSESLVIDGSTGNVGIGTTSPNNILHISDAGATTLVRVGNNGAYDAGIYFNTSTDWTIGTDTSNSNAFTIGNSSSVGTSPKIVIQTGGNVGIGDTNPVSYKLAVNGTVKGDSFSVDGMSSRIFAPSGAVYNGSGAQTGYLIVKLPDEGVSYVNNMMTGVIRVFDYAGNESFDVHFAGYWYSGYNWTNCSAWIDSQANVDRNFTVRWGSMTGYNGAGSRPFISIGSATTTWSYVKFSVINFEPGHSNAEAYKWDSGWNMDVSTTLPGSSLRDTSTTQGNNWARSGQDIYYGSGTGNVGIGVVPESTSRLHIKYISGNNCKMTLESNNSGDSFINYSAASNEMAAGFDTSAAQFIIAGGDNLSVPKFALTQSTGDTTIAGTLTQNSDITLKENIKPLESQLEIVSKLNPVSYNKIGFEDNEVGFIAQEVEKLLPELVREDKDGLKSLAYGNMNAILVKAIQELKAEIEILKNK